MSVHVEICHWPWKHLSLLHGFESSVPDDFYVLFAATELNFTLHDMQIQRHEKEVVKL